MLNALAGVRVAITEHRLTSQLTQLLERQGGTVVACPLVQETPVEIAEGSRLFIDTCETETVDYIIFYTGVGVDMLFRAANRPELISRSIVIARGPKAVNGLRRAGVRIDFVADAPTTAGILQTLSRQDLNGKLVLAQLYGQPIPELNETLEAAGATVKGISLYRYTQAADAGMVEDLLRQIAAGSVDAITFTSASQISFLMTAARTLQLEETIRGRLRNDVVVVSIGEVTSRALQAEGVEARVMPAEPRMGPMVLALAEYFEKNPKKCSTPSL